MRFLRWFILLVIIAVAIHPLQTQAQNRQGAGVLKIKKNNIEYEALALNRLFFNYQPPMDVEHPDGTVTRGSGKHMKIPKEILALNGQKVAIKSFVMPLEYDGKTVKTFLMADELVTCLFCAMLGYDRWMSASSVDPRGFPVTDEQLEYPFTVYGTLEVGEELQDGQLVSLYRIKVDSLDAKREKIFGLFGLF